MTWTNSKISSTLQSKNTPQLLSQDSNKPNCKNNPLNYSYPNMYKDWKSSMILYATSSSPIKCIKHSTPSKSNGMNTKIPTTKHLMPPSKPKFSKTKSTKYKNNSQTLSAFQKKQNLLTINYWKKEISIKCIIKEYKRTRKSSMKTFKN